jgi:YqjK-like protein
MSAHQRSLALQRQELVARSAGQRSGLVAQWETIVTKTAAADRVLSTLRRHPVAVAAALGSVVLLGSRRLFDVSERLLTLYLLLRRR